MMNLRVKSPQSWLRLRKIEFLFLLFVVVLLSPEVGSTSSEGVLITASFQIDSDGIGSSGPVSVRGRRGLAGKFESLSIDAFGKRLFLATDILENIPAYSNGIQLTFENGYRKLGGRTIYIIFLTGFASTITERVVLSIDEDGKSELVQPGAGRF